MFSYYINKHPFWDEIVIQNQYLEVVILSKGGTIKSLKYIYGGNVVPLILTYADDQGYINDNRYCGAYIAPVAGRIKPNSISFDGESFSLPEESPGECLHSGSRASHSKQLKYKLKITKSSISVYMWYENLPADTGIPGNNVYYLVYRLSNEPSLRFETWIKLKDDFALFNPTSHMYFNFSDANILNHQILSSITHVAKQIHSTSTLEREEFLLFNEANKASLNDILSYFSYSGKGDLDHTFFFDANDRKIRLTNQKMEMIVRTSYPCVRIYCASNGFSFPLENITDSSKKHLGVTLECQYLDNDIQLRGIESQMLVRKGENRHEFIEYIFLPRNLSSFSV